MRTRFTLLALLALASLASAAVTAPAIRTKEQWGGAAGSSGGSNQPNNFIIHHTAGPGSSYTGDATIRGIQNYHINDRGWSDVGYHYLVGPDGIIYQGRLDSVIGAHAAGANTGSLGICFVGDFTRGTEVPSEAAKTSVINLMAYLGERYNINPPTNIRGHRQAGTTATNCPGDRLFPLLGELATSAANVIAAGTGGAAGGAGAGGAESSGPDCTSPGTFDAALGTCSDGVNTGNCVNSATDCGGGVARTGVEGCDKTCCFSSTCGCHEDPNRDGIRASPSVRECTSSSGTRGVCIETATGNANSATCPSGNFADGRCPEDGDTVRCCLDTQPDCTNTLAAVGIPFFFLSAGGIAAYGVTKMYEPGKSKAGRKRGNSDVPLAVSRKRSTAGTITDTITTTRPSQKRSSRTSIGSKTRPSRSSTTSKSKSRSKSTNSKGSAGRRASQTSNGSRSSKNSKNSKNSKGSKGSKGTERRTSQTSNGTRKKSTGSRGGKTSKSSKGSRGTKSRH